MNRLEDIKITQECPVVEKNIWMVISEGWCGDAAQLIPVF
jgi:hypothetical protein